HVRLLARSPRVIVGISIADVNAAVDGKMVKLDNRYRVDLAAGHLCLNERSAAMLGTDAPLRIETPAPQPTSTQRIRVVLDQLMGKTDRTIDGEVIKEDGDG